MKGLLYKDFINLQRNAKLMLLPLLIFAVAFLPSASAGLYPMTISILASRFVISTFSFDEQSQWTKYALTTPVSRKEYVAEKFVLLLFFSITGALFGLAVAMVGNLCFHISILFDSLLFFTIFGMFLSIIFGCVTVMLIFRFGTENARALSFLFFLIPFGLCFALHEILRTLQFQLPFTQGWMLFIGSTLVVIGLSYLIYRISISIFSKKELSS